MFYIIATINNFIISGTINAVSEKDAKETFRLLHCDTFTPLFLVVRRSSCIVGNNLNPQTKTPKTLQEAIT